MKKINNPWRHRTVTRLQRITIILWEGRCTYCGKWWLPWRKFEIDHAKPYSRGRLTFLPNLDLTYRSCNRQKGDRTSQEYRHWRLVHGLPTASPVSPLAIALFVLALLLTIILFS